MAKELGVTGKVELDSANNCLAGVAATAFNLISTTEKINGHRLYLLMPRPTHEYLEYIFTLLKQAGIDKVSFNLVELPRSKNEIKEIITGCFSAGCLISLAINTDNWIQDIIGAKEKPDSSLHVILIHGLYQPHDNQGNTYLYISDPYCMKTLFLCWDDIFSLIKKCPDTLLGVFTDSELPEHLKKYLYKGSISKSKAKKIKDRLPNPKKLFK